MHKTASQIALPVETCKVMVWRKTYMQRAAGLWEATAAQGHAEAQYQLAICYKFGHGVLGDVGRTMQLLEAAAAQGLAKAQCCLGMCHWDGYGVAGDEQRAAELLEEKLDNTMCCGPRTRNFDRISAQRNLTS